MCWPLARPSAALPRMRQRQNIEYRHVSSVFFFLLVVLMSLKSMDSLQLKNRRITNVTITYTDASAGTIESFRFITKTKKEPFVEIPIQEITDATEFDISGNYLRTLPAALFRAMVNVKRIILSKNPIRSFEPKTFSGLPALQEIIMEKSNLSHFPEHFIEDCPLLTRIQINASYVHTIPNTSIANLPSLQVIDLSRNNVTKLYPGSFTNLPAIHTLDLSYNNLTVVPTELFTVSKGWKELDFRRNNITSAPAGLKLAIVDGWVSFERNIWVEIQEHEFANASRINALNMRSMGIFTVNSRAFQGMSALTKLDLGDNVISVLAGDAFDGLDNLEVLSLKENNLRHVAFTAFPPKLEQFGLESNQLDEMPTFSPGVEPASVKLLDLSWNRLTNFTSSAFTAINQTIQSIHLDYNEIQSVPRTALLTLFELNHTNITLEVNPGIGSSVDVRYRSKCPGGSVFESITHPFTSTFSVFGCIQCSIGTYHNQDANTCQPCGSVSARAYTSSEGATTCMYCPFTSALQDNREQCSPFECNLYCWLTIMVACFFPLLLMGGKCLVYFGTPKKPWGNGNSRQDQDEQDEMDDWIVEQLIRQVATTQSGRQYISSQRSDQGNHHNNNSTSTNTTTSNGAMIAKEKIYDLSKDTQLVVLLTLQENFLERRANRQQAQLRASFNSDQAVTASGGGGGAAAANAAQGDSSWDDLSWECFHMSRILSRNFHGEVFLGEYESTQVVVKRLMTLRFDIRELFEMMRDVEALLTLHHDHIVQYMGTIWSDVEYLCVIGEYLPMGDLRALLESEETAKTTRAGIVSPALLLSEPPSSGSMSGLGSRSISGSMTQSFTSATMTNDSSFAGTNGASAMPAWLPMNLQIMADVASALAFVHDQNICHRDLRSRNVLLTKDYRAKLNDFTRTVNEKYVGTTITIVADVTTTSLASSSAGYFEDRVSLPVIASEVGLVYHQNQMETSQKNQVVFLPSADIYAFGILLIEVWCHKHVAFSVANVPGDNHHNQQREGSMDSRRSSASGRGEGEVDVELESLRRQDLALVDEEKRQRFMRALRVCVENAYDDGASDADATTHALSVRIMDKVLRLVEDCIHQDPRKRPTAQSLVESFTQLGHAVTNSAAIREQLSATVNL